MTTTAKGYGIEATLTPTELRAHGTNKAFHFALVGKDGPEELVVPLSDIAEAKHFAPPKWAMGSANGRLDVFTAAGARYQMHYRVKKQAEFADFAEQVVAAVSARN